MMEDVKKLASECLNCVNKPCMKGCPLNNDIPEFIKCIKNDDIKGAFMILQETTPLGALCGRICPHENQCQGSCIKNRLNSPVSIGALEAYVFDYALNNNYSFSMEDNKINKKVAIIGGGPAGLSCAYFLRKNGVDVTIYEKHNYLGGLLVHGIPDFRLDKELVRKNIKMILDMGINVKYEMELGRNLDISELENEYDAIFIGIGANESRKINIDGITLDGVYWGNELLESGSKIDYNGKNVVVNGGGNTAIDVARIAKKSGAKKVTIIYRRNKEVMPALKCEVEDAINDGIEFIFNANIVKVIGSDKVNKIEFVRTNIREKDGESVIEDIKDSNQYIDTDYLIMAIGSKQSDMALNDLMLEKNSSDKILIDEESRTSRDKIYAGGDACISNGTVAKAMRDGKNAAYSIISLLKN